MNLPDLTLDKDAPETWSERLREIASFLDLADEAFVMVSTELDRQGIGGEPYEPGDAMQKDLRNLADWLAERE